MGTIRGTWATARRARAALAVGVAALLACGVGTTAAAQNVDDAPPVPRLAGGTDPLPPAPPRGAWGEVIMATSQWVVVQNHQGQQFPIAVDSIAQFLIRWPTDLGALGPASLVEAVGNDVGSNTMRTDHVDVFEGSDRNLVNPAYENLLANNRAATAVDPTFSRMMNAFDVGAQNLLYGWAYPTQPGNGAGLGQGGAGFGGQLHVVGNVLDNNPLRLALPGNNFSTVLPQDEGGMTVTQVTRGNPSFARKGDLVFLMPVNLTPRTVVLTQLVLYKTVPLREFRP